MVMDAVSTEVLPTFKDACALWNKIENPGLGWSNQANGRILKATTS